MGEGNNENYFGIKRFVLSSNCTYKYLQKKTVFGIQPLIFEFFSLAIVGLYSGLYFNQELLRIEVIVMTTAFFLAVIFDPTIWRWQGVKIQDEQKLSFFMNSKALAIFLSSIVAGRILKMIIF